ncbi:MAG: restriction endonuclease [Alkaliphilus sp.]
MVKPKSFLKRLCKQVKHYKESRANSRRFNAYYLNTKEDSRNIVAKKIDFIVLRLFAFLFVFAATLLRFQNIINSIFIASFFLCIFHIIVRRKRNKKLRVQKKHKRRLIASQKVYKNIMNKPEVELQKYIAGILVKSGLTNIEEVSLNSSNFTYNAVFKNATISVSFFIYETDYLIELKELKEFLFNSKSNNKQKGIVMTTSDFTKDCYELVNELSENYKLLLLNKDKLIALIESNGMFPKEEEIDESIEERIDSKGKFKEKYKNQLFNPDKVKEYLFLSIFLFILSFFTPYIIFYMAAAGFALGLACIAFVIRVKNKEKSKKNGSNEESKLLDAFLDV